MSSDAAPIPPLPPPEQGLEIRSHFVRSRNALVTRATFSELYVDYFLHLSTYQLHPAAEHVALFKDALAAFVLHCAARPRYEIIAWTLHFEDPMVNLFLTADNEECTVTGRVLADNVREMGGNHLYADVVAYGKPPRRSVVPFAGAEPFRAAEAFYLQSEQRPARVFSLAPEEFAMVGSHPDCDTAWFEGLTSDQVRDLEKTETLSLLERRRYEWRCGCNQRKLLRVLSQVARKNPEEIFGQDPSAQVSCPRCGAKHVITREAMEAYLASHPE
ncbi:MAG TPA: Hsp33 family molecular chaperone HslO [Opitutaceae bacterium]|nr:Hsp33 family molecular chaperone HslO [Opitutaceae bacterium]